MDPGLLPASLRVLDLSENPLEGSDLGEVLGGGRAPGEEALGEKEEKGGRVRKPKLPSGLRSLGLRHCGLSGDLGAVWGRVREGRGSGPSPGSPEGVEPHEGGRFPREGVQEEESGGNKKAAPEGMAQGLLLGFFSELQCLDLARNKLEGNLASVALPPSLTDVSLRANRLQGTLDDVWLPEDTLKCDLAENDLQGDLEAFHFPPGIEDLRLGENQKVVGDMEHVQLPPTLLYFDLRDEADRFFSKKGSDDVDDYFRGREDDDLEEEKRSNAEGIRQRLSQLPGWVWTLLRTLVLVLSMTLVTCAGLFHVGILPIYVPPLPI